MSLPDPDPTDERAIWAAFRWYQGAYTDLEAERDTALRHVEALAEPPMHLDGVDYPAAVEAARTFLLSMREKADTDA